jgi:hypothetical protein
MPKVVIERVETYRPDGTVEVREFEVLVPTDEELIAEKEAELLKVYAELQAIKDNVNNNG